MTSNREVDLTDRLTAELYAEMRRIAAIRMSRERPDHTLQATALVHEAYLRLGESPEARWTDRTHFLATAARIMRNILIDHARKHRRRVELLEYFDPTAGAGLEGVDVLVLDQAIDALAEKHERCARVLEFRYILGFTNGETAEVLGVSERTVKGDAQFGLAWLRRNLAEPELS